MRTADAADGHQAIAARGGSLEGLRITWQQRPCDSVEPCEFSISGATLAMVLAELVEECPSGHFQGKYDPAYVGLELQSLSTLAGAGALSDASDPARGLWYVSRALDGAAARLRARDLSRALLETARVEAQGGEPA